MATINSANLQIQLDLPANQARVTVSGVVEFNDFELGEMREPTPMKFQLDCELWEDDPDTDDFLLKFPAKFFPDATPTKTEKYRFEKVIPGKTLDNENSGDGGDAWDEIYAKVTLTNVSIVGSKPVTMKTKVIKHDFMTTTA